mgnify:CR=1 FL=1
MGYLDQYNLERDHTDRNFTGQQSNEEIVLCNRKHPIVLFSPTIGFLAITIIFVLALIGLNEIGSASNSIFESGSLLNRILLLFLFAGYTYSFHRFFNIIFNYYLQVTILTSFRVILVKKTIFFSNNKDTVDLHKIQDLKISQDGFFSTLLDYGTLTLELSAIHETKVVSYLPRPDEWFRIINSAKRDYIEKRTVRKHVAPPTPHEEDIMRATTKIHQDALHALARNGV